MTLTGTVRMDDFAAFDMASHSLTAGTIYLGWYGNIPTTLLNRAPLAATSLYVANQPFDLNASDSVQELHLNNVFGTLYSSVSSLDIYNGSQATTTAMGNVTGDVTIYESCSATLGTSMTLAGTLDMHGNATLDMAGNPLTADTILWGWHGYGPTTLLNRAPVTANRLVVEDSPFIFHAGDVVRDFILLDDATTSATGNVTHMVAIDAWGVPSTLTLGAAMTLTGDMEVTSGATLNMAGHSLTADGLLLGFGGRVINNGRIAVSRIDAYACPLTLYPGDSAISQISFGYSTLTVSQANGQMTGLTFQGVSVDKLDLYDGGVFNLNFGQTPFSHWIFRWRNPDSANNWIGTLTSEIGAGRISVNPSSGYSIADLGGYTYIYVPSHAADIDWQGGNAAGPTNWGLAANWSNSTVEPNGPGVIVSFGNQSAAYPIVEMVSGDKTVGGIIFLPTTSTTVQSSGGYDLTLDNNGDISTIDVSGDHQIMTPVSMNNDLQVIGTGTLTLSGGISGAHMLIVAGNLTASSIRVDTLRIEGGGMAAADNYVLSQPADFDWQGGSAAGPTNWGLAANWSANTVEPNGTGVIVSFGNQSPANPIVDIISGDKTVGGIVFLSTTSTTLQSTGGYDLMLDNNGDISTIDVSGDHQVTAPVIMNNDVQVIGSGTLALPGGISGSHTLIVTGNLIASSIQVDSLRIEGGGMAVADIGGDGSSLAAVPEPRALVLLGVFAVGLSCAAWRRRTSKIAEICHSIR
jgi:hypothetical protein